MKVLGILLAMLLMAFFAGCGSATETGNPWKPQAEAPASGSVYQSNGLALNYDGSWTVTESTLYSTTSGSSGDVQESMNSDPASTSIIYISAGDLIDSSITIYVEKFVNPPVSLKDYLDENFSEKEFTEYANEYASGYMFKTEGASGGSEQEIYLLNGDVLYYIVAELFEGSGSTEARQILSSLRFAE